MRARAQERTRSKPGTGELRERRETIRTIVRAQPVESQEHLRQLLAEQGFEVTQATLSRDLARLGARRLTRPDGGSSYELAADAASTASPLLLQLAAMIVGVVESLALVVVQTRPGSAPAVALGLDQARLAEVVGTLAGDDTVFVAPARGTSVRQLARRLRTLWKKGASEVSS